MYSGKNNGNTGDGELPKITGAITQVAAGVWWQSRALTMVDKLGESNYALVGSTTTSNIKSIGIDASNSSTIYGNLQSYARVVPGGTAMYYCIKY